MLRPKLTVQSIGDEICADATFVIAPYHLSETEVDQIRRSAGGAVTYDFTHRVLTVRARYTQADPARAGSEFGKMLDRAEKALNHCIEQKDSIQKRFMEVVTRIVGNLE
ncbi:MAG: hypothetical protein HND41_11215 [Chlorobi bacterium]|nr:hypothetical protein [Chlorobiota bacterium]